MGIGIVAFFLKNKNLILIGVLLAAFAAGYYDIKLLKSELATAQAEKAAIQSELKVSQDSVATLRKSIDDQNEAIKKMKIADQERFNANQAEVNKAKVAASNYKKQAEDIMRLRPSEKISRCDSANELINKEIQNAK